MVDRPVAERLAQHGGAAQPLGRGGQRARDLGHRGVVVDVARHRRIEVQPLFDPLQTGGQKRGLGQVGVHVGPGHPAFHPHRLGPLAAQAEPGGAVVHGPRDLGRRERPLGETLVGIDVGRHEHRHVARVFQHPGAEGAHRVGHAVIGVGVVERGLGPLPQRQVHMRGAAHHPGPPLGQEGRADPLLPGDLLDRLLGDGVVVGAVHRGGIADVQLFLPRLGLALGILDRHARGQQVIADRPHHMLFLHGGQHVVVEVVGRIGLEHLIVLRPQAVVIALEQKELQFGRHHRRQAHPLGPGDLALQDRAGGMFDVGMVVVVADIAEHHRRPLQPRHAAQRRKVGLHHVVAVSRRPRGRPIAVRRRHIEVGGQQVVAAVGFLPRAVHEMLRGEPLAHQAALHVDDAGQNRVDLARFHGLLERVEAEVSGHGGAPCRAGLRGA